MSRLKPDPAGCLKPALAREHAQAAAQRMRQHDKTVRAYKCRECGCWHVGGVASNKRRPLPTFPYYYMDTLEATPCNP